MLGCLKRLYEFSSLATFLSLSFVIASPETNIIFFTATSRPRKRPLYTIPNDPSENFSSNSTSGQLSESSSKRNLRLKLPVAVFPTATASSSSSSSS
mmetsp:Transcript_20809/g.59367  ORF Transcript_20809/g.59367 Transcript_20809/m.59367 type:complete len:97 (-) Transcript_20809:34-324(-)